MKVILTLAWMTWTELRRDRFVAVFAFLVLALLVLSSLLGSLSLDEQTRLLVHLGFQANFLGLLVLALFLGSSVLQKEIDRQTCLIILSRPVSRSQFLIGKWLGLCLLLFFFWLGGGLLHFALLDFQFSAFQFLAAHLTLLIEGLLVVSCGVFFSSFLRPLLSMVSAFSLFLAGHWRQDLLYFAKRSRSAAYQDFADFCQWISPPLDRLEIRSVHFLSDSAAAFPVASVVHLLIWICLFVWAGTLIWRHRDLV